MKDDKIIQLKLKTVRDLRHYLSTRELARHVVHDNDTDWWWFADNRNRLLEEVFNSGSRIVCHPRPSGINGKDEIWEITSDLIAAVRGFRLQTTYLTTSMTKDLLIDLFWTDFLNQERDRFEYWDMDNPDNGFEAYLFYREMDETGAYLESPQELSS